MLVSRMVVALIFIPLLLTAALLRGPLLVGVAVSATAIACAEFAWMFRARAITLSPLASAAVGLAYVTPAALGYLLPAAPGAVLWPWLAGATLMAALLSVRGPGAAAERLRNLGLVLAGGSYIGFLTSQAILIGALPRGDLWGALALLGTFGADTGGYLVGRRFGRTPLAPAISPRKTWEGFSGSFLLPLALVAAMSLVLPIPLTHVVPLAVILTLAAVLGDLLESWVKRVTGVKDASKLLAGHGGYLDRMDSLLPVMFVVYQYAVHFAA